MTGLWTLRGVKGHLEENSWRPSSDARLYWFLLAEDDMRCSLWLWHWRPDYNSSSTTYRPEIVARR